MKAAKVTNIRATRATRTVKAKIAILSLMSLIFLGGSNASFAVDLVNGQTKYEVNCMLCHGNLGQGDGPAAASLAKKPANISKKLNSLFSKDAKLTRSVLQGKNTMPAFKGSLSILDIADIFAYLRKANK